MSHKVKMTINGVQYNTKMRQYDKIITIFPSIFTTPHFYIKQFNLLPGAVTTDGSMKSGKNSQVI